MSAEPAPGTGTYLRPALPLRTRRLVLRAFSLDDVPAVHAYEQREDVTRFLYFAPRSLAEVRDSVEQRVAWTSIDERSDSLRLAVTLTMGGALIGDVMLRRNAPEHAQGELGYVMDPAYQGHGYATEAAAELVRLGFEAGGLHRIYARLDARNTASARVAERLGMRREAHLVENEWIKGEWQSELVYALLASEWRAGR